MSYEIEQKYRCLNHEIVATRLLQLGALHSPSVQQEDTYLAHPSRDFAQTGEAFRIRRVGDHNAVTYKGPKQSGPTKTRRELEIPFANGEQHLERLRQLFDALGFRPVLTVGKVRTSYHLTHDGRAFEVVLDDADGLGTFVEVEAIVEDQGDLEAAQKAVIAVSKALGLTDLEPRSYLRMALERQATLVDS